MSRRSRAIYCAYSFVSVLDTSLHTRYSCIVVSEVDQSRQLVALDQMRLLEVLAYAVYSPMLIGNRPPSTERLYQRMTHPVVGDLVVEVTAIYQSEISGASDWSHLGILERVEHDSDDLPWYFLRGLDGYQKRWWNAAFVAVPSSLRQLFEWQGRE